MLLFVCLFLSSPRRPPPAAEETPRPHRGGSSHTDRTHTAPIPHDAGSHHLAPHTHTAVAGQPRLFAGLPSHPHHGTGVARSSGADAHRAHTLLLQRTHVSVRRAAAAAVPHHQTPPDVPPSEPKHHHPGALHPIVLLRHPHPLTPHGLLQVFTPAPSSSPSSFGLPTLSCPASYLRSPISSELPQCLVSVTAVLSEKNQSAVRSRFWFVNRQIQKRKKKMKSP